MTSAINLGYLLMFSGYFTQWLGGHWMPSIILAGSVIGVLGYGACLFSLSSIKKIVVIVGLAIVGVGIVLCLVGLFYVAFGNGFWAFKFFLLIVYSGLQASAVTLTAIVCASMGTPGSEPTASPDQNPYPSLGQNVSKIILFLITKSLSYYSFLIAISGSQDDTWHQMTHPMMGEETIVHQLKD